MTQLLKRKMIIVTEKATGKTFYNLRASNFDDQKKYLELMLFQAFNYRYSIEVLIKVNGHGTPLLASEKEIYSDDDGKTWYVPEVLDRAE